MIKQMLQLRRTDVAQRETVAWLFPGSENHDWLTTVLRWPVSHGSLRFLTFRDDPQNTNSGGTLVIPATVPEVSEFFQCRRYGLAAERVYVPVEAVVVPPLTPSEWNDLLPDGDSLFVWRPVEGLTRFDRADIRGVLDLASVPAERPADYTKATMAAAFSHRLVSVASADPPLNLSDVIDEWQNEIGPTRPLDELPPVPNEPAPGMSERWAKLQAGLSAVWNRIPRWLPIALVIAVLAMTLLWISSIPSVVDRLSLAALARLVFLAAFVFFWLSKLFPPGNTASSSSSPMRSEPSNQAGPHIVSKPGMIERFVNSAGALVVSAVAGIAQIISKGTTGTGKPKANQSQREREVERLLHMLETNPDEGLKYAIPLASESGRGETFSGNQLINQEIRFGQSTSGPASSDPWQIEREKFQELNCKYRNMAEREQTRGRYQRAAYIYSKLLGDWISCANALMAGQFYAEAAAIYLDRLKNISAAATCYERAGQFDRALKLYLDQSQWIEAGDLCMRIGRTNEGLAYYHTAVAKHRKHGNIASAAEVLEMKLGNVDGSLELLRNTWPTHSSAHRYLDSWFALAAKHHRHDESHARVDEIASATLFYLQATKVLPHLKKVVQEYPEVSVSRRAATQIMSIIGRHLAKAGVNEARELTAYLPAVTPTDRLLSRDCDRFVDRLRQSADLGTKSDALTQRDKGRRLRLRTSFQLKVPIDTENVLAGKQGWIAFTDTPARQLVLATWSGQVVTMPLEFPAVATRNCSLVALNEAEKAIWVSHTLKETIVQWPDNSENWTVFRPTYLPVEILAAESLPTGQSRAIWLDDSGAAWYSFYTSHAHLGQSFRIAEGLDFGVISKTTSTSIRATMSSVRSEELIAVLPLVDGRFYGECFDASGQCLWASQLPANQVIISQTSDQGWMLLIQDDRCDLLLLRDSCVILPDWFAAKAEFLAAGLLAITDDERVALYQAGTGELIVEQHHPSAPPIAVADAGDLGRFSVIRTDGTVEVWELCH